MSSRTVEFPFDNKVPSIYPSIYQSIYLAINLSTLISFSTLIFILRHRLNLLNVKKKMNARACPCRLPAQYCVFSQLVQAVACCGQLVCVWSYCGSATQTRFYLNISVVLAAKRPSYPLHWSSHQELCPLCDVQASVLCVCALVCVCVCFRANTVKYVGTNVRICRWYCVVCPPEDFCCQYCRADGRQMESGVRVVNQMTEGDVLNGSPSPLGFCTGVTQRPRQRKRKGNLSCGFFSTTISSTDWIIWKAFP